MAQMGLNIKNAETHRLVQELAALTGESMTVAVTEAVRERLDRVRREWGVRLADRLLAIGKECAGISMSRSDPSITATCCTASADCHGDHRRASGCG
jgi:antitoxin VapB